MSYPIEAINEELWSKNASLSSKYMPIGLIQNKLTENTAHSSYDMIQDGYYDTPVARIIPPFNRSQQVVASGGTITYANGYKFHTFTAALTEDFYNSAVSDYNNYVTRNGWTWGNGGIVKNTTSLGATIRTPASPPQVYSAWFGAGGGSGPFVSSPTITFSTNTSATLTFSFAGSTNFGGITSVTVSFAGTTLATYTSGFSAWQTKTINFTPATLSGTFTFTANAGGQYAVITGVTLSQNLIVTTGGPVSALVVGGGGGGGNSAGGGGGGAVFKETALDVLSYSVVIGGGGAEPGAKGGDSSFALASGIGGGGGGIFAASNPNINGGCGGGGNYPPGNPSGGIGSQGGNGGNGLSFDGNPYAAPGGGGMGGPGGSVFNGQTSIFGYGGPGKTYTLGGISYTVGGGGGGYCYAATNPVLGGVGGGGYGGYAGYPEAEGQSGTPNTGGGGGSKSVSGGSGIVVVAYPSPPPPPPPPPPSPPSVAFSNFNWLGTKGTTSALPRWVFTISGTAPTLLQALLESSPTGSAPFSPVANQTLLNSALSYNYTGATVRNLYYKVTITASNALGSSAFSDTQLNVLAADINATGGTISIPATGFFAGYKVHTFTSNGTFTLIGPPAGAALGVLMYGGGGGGGNYIGGGGGAAGYFSDREAFSVGASSVIVGNGGSGGLTAFSDGADGSQSSTLTGTIYERTAEGGGGGAYFGNNGKNGISSATSFSCGGGGGGNEGTFGGSGLNAGGFGPFSGSGYYGGGGGAGFDGNGLSATSSTTSGDGGPGIAGPTGVSVLGGGGGGSGLNGGGFGGIASYGGGNGGGNVLGVNTPIGRNALPNTGSGGGGGGNNGSGTSASTAGGNGGSGIVYIYYTP